MFIAVHLDADRKAKAIRAAASLGLQPREFVCRVLVPVWMFAAEQDGSGNLPITDKMLEAITFGVCRDLSTLIDHGFIDETSTGFVVHDWEEHQNFFRKRAENAERVREHRKRKHDGNAAVMRCNITGDDGNAPVTILEEKRREEKRTHSEGASVCAFSTFWAKWPKREKEKLAAAEWDKLLPIDQASAIVGAERYSVRMAAEGIERRYMASPIDWLRQGRWREEQPPAKPAAAKPANNAAFTDIEAGHIRRWFSRPIAERRAMADAYFNERDGQRVPFVIEAFDAMHTDDVRAVVKLEIENALRPLINATDGDGDMEAQPAG